MTSTLDTLPVVTTKTGVPGALAYFWEGAYIDPSDGLVQTRFLLTDRLAMTYQRAMSAKQGRWTASYFDTPAEAHAAFRAIGESTPTTFFVTELLVELTLADIAQVTTQAKRGTDTRFRATHHVENHQGVLQTELDVHGTPVYVQRAGDKGTANALSFDRDRWLRRFDRHFGDHTVLTLPDTGEGPDVEPTVEVEDPTPEPEPVPEPEPTVVYTRPNGETYHPREVQMGGAKSKDVAVIQRAYGEGMSVLLSGVPGTGKTAMIEAALNNVVTVQGTLDTETSDFVGQWYQRPDGTYGWADGPLVIAMEAGRPLLIDEVALIDPRVMATVYSVMDGRDELAVTANPERGTVKAAEGFLVFGAYNPDVPGAVVSDALLSRFAMAVEVHTDWEVAGMLDVPAPAVSAAVQLNAKLNANEVSAAPQLRELIAFRDVAKVFGQDAAVSNLLAFAHPEDRTVFTEVIVANFGGAPKALAF